MQICSHLLKKFLMEKFFFVHWFVQVNRQTTTVKKKIIYFLKNCCLFIHNFWKSPCNLQIFSTWCLDVRFWDLLYLFAWSSIHSIIFRSSHPEMFLGKGVQFTGEQTCRSVISIKFLCKFIEITHGRGCSPVNLQHIFITPFPKNTSGRLLLCLHRREEMCWFSSCF